MEEKNLNEAQVAEQTTSQQDENKNMSDVDALKAEIKKLNETIDYLRTSNNREYRKVDILKGALKMLKDKYSVSDMDYYCALICGGAVEIDIDNILYQLSK
jgi:rubrerythrin